VHKPIEYKQVLGTVRCLPKLLMTILLIQQTHFHLWIAIHMCVASMYRWTLACPQVRQLKDCFRWEDAFFHCCELDWAVITWNA